jgi:mono/diheme cytochrome c family protein
VSKLRKGKWRSLPLLAALVAGCDLPGQPNSADRPVPADRVLDFNALYQTCCAGCHGADGRLGPAPPLNDPLFLAIVPDAELRHVISKGRAVSPGQKSAMPAFARDKGGPLTAAQVKVLAEGIKPRWGQPPESGAATPPPYEDEETYGSPKGGGVRPVNNVCANVNCRPGSHND